MASLRDKRGRFVSKGGSRFSDTPTPDGVRLAQLLEQIKRGPSVKIGALARKLSKTREGSTGEPRTLVDTGRMLGAVSWLVEMVRGGKS